MKQHDLTGCALAINRKGYFGLYGVVRKCRMLVHDTLDLFPVLGVGAQSEFVIFFGYGSRKSKFLRGHRRKPYDGRRVGIFEKEVVQHGFEEMALFAFVDELPERLVVDGMRFVLHHGIGDVEKILVGLLAPVECL